MQWVTLNWILEAREDALKNIIEQLAESEY